MIKLLLAVLLFAVVLPAQIIVDPLGGGNYTNLQTAINGAAPGSTIIVRNLSYLTPLKIKKPLTIRKPLTIVGDPDVVIMPVGIGMATVLDIDVVGKGTVALGGLGVFSHELYPVDGPLVTASCDHLLMVDCGFDANYNFPCCDHWEGQPAIAASCDRLTLVRSYAGGGHSWADYDDPRTSGDGAPGITGADWPNPWNFTGDIVLLDSSVIGGNGAQFFAKEYPPPPCGQMTAVGGDGIEGGGLAWMADSEVGGGAGGWATNQSGQVVCSWPGGRGQASPPPSGFRIAPMKTGQVWIMTFPTVGSGALLVGEQADQRQSIPGITGELFLATDSIISVPLAPNAWGIGVPVPNNQVLVGGVLAMQILEIPWLATPTLSRPIIDLIR